MVLRVVQDSGFLSLQDVGLLAAELGFPLETEEAFATAITAMDMNNDGNVDCAEFEAWWKSQIASLRERP